MARELSREARALIPLDRVLATIQGMADNYPIDVFPDPVDGEATREQIAAFMARHVCGVLVRECMTLAGRAAAGEEREP